MARRRSKTNATPGFAIEIKPDTELQGAMLIAEFAGGGYRPVSQVINLNEAREIAHDDLAGDKGQPARTYAVWARGLDGEYCIAARISIR